MDQPVRILTHSFAGTVRASLVVHDDRGFTHYYEDVVTTPSAVRDAYGHMVRSAPTVPRSATTR